MRHFLLATITALLLTGLAYAAAPPPQWLAHESWPGGKQYDPRLERRVKFWGTGVPAAEVFASITKQTGVELGFSPPDDDNTRICLNIYLNPKEPPTLRDLLVQIGWVMDCAWAVEGEGEGRRYLLLHSSIGGGVEARLRADMRRESEAEERVGREAGQEVRARAAAKLRDLESALALSRDEAIRKYRGQDDLLLLALLDPARRALARFLLTLPETTLARAQLAEPEETGWEADWGQLTAAQRELLHEAMRPYVEERRQEQQQGRNFDENWADWAAIEALGLRLHLSLADRSGGFYAEASYTVATAYGGEEVRSIGIPFLQLATDPRLPAAMDQAVEAEVLLRRLLGEQVSDAQLREARGQWYRGYLDQRRRQRAEAQWASLAPLSAENAARLSALRLPVQADGPYALWQLQEAVAAGSGMHVISDCFFQPAESLSERLGLLPPGVAPGLTALAVLRLATVSWLTIMRLPAEFGSAPESGVEGWEWGDAGRFLRFRSRNRDAWRAGFLPGRAVTTLDAWLALHLPAEIAADQELPEVELRLDLHDTTVFLADLTSWQREWGGPLCYGDPSAESQRYSSALREAVLATWRQCWYLPLLARLSREQLQQLDGDGLTCEVDISLLDMPAEQREWWTDNVRRGDVLKLDHIGSEEAGFCPDPERPAAGYTATAWSHLWQMHPDGTGGTGSAFARNLLLSPQRLPHLVPPPDGAMPSLSPLQPFGTSPWGTPPQGLDY